MFGRRSASRLWRPAGVVANLVSAFSSLDADAQLRARADSARAFFQRRGF